MEQYKLEAGIAHYLIDNLAGDLSIKKTSAHFGYTPVYFARLFVTLFGVPYVRFITKLRIREAAREILDGDTRIAEIAERYGYSAPNKFTRAFTREMGVSPRDFRKAQRVVPDMPLKKKIKGHTLFLNYVRTEDAIVIGKAIPAPGGINTNILDKCAYALQIDDVYHPEDVNDEEVGIWWGDKPYELYYVIGRAFHKNAIEARRTLKENEVRFNVPGTDYAVFSIERDPDPDLALDTHREMVYYAMAEWLTINNKRAEKMYYTYESFANGYTYLYVPIQKSMIEHESVEAIDSLGLENWIKYIDSHIEENITIAEISAHFHYSEAHFRKIFRMYYEYSPSDYIKKKRLYMALNDMRKTDNHLEKEDIARKYHFKNLDSFYFRFKNETGLDPDNITNTNMRTVDLSRYYEHNKDKIKITTSYEDAYVVLGKALELRDNSEEQQEYNDIPAMVEYWFLHDFEVPAEGMNYTGRPQYNMGKAALWVGEKGSANYEYILGPVVEKTSTNFSGGARKVETVSNNVYILYSLSSGKYTRIESVMDSDDSKLKETYRMLTRLSFYGWVKANRYRVDFSRLTYVRYINHKLYFYIPVFD